MATELMPFMMQERNRIYPAIGLALVVEILLVSGAYSLLSHQVQPPVVPTVTVVTLALAPTPAPKPESVPAALPHQPQSEPPKPHVTPARQVTHAVIHRATTPALVPAPVPAVPATLAQTAPDLPASLPVQPTQAPAPEKVAAPSAPDKNFEGALRAAIQAALHYPESAKMAGMSGRARVAFDYRDGTVSNARVVITSGMGLLDRAALAAVENAALPKPAPEWAGKTLSEQIWVTFDLEDRS